MHPHPFGTLIQLKMAITVQIKTLSNVIQQFCDQHRGVAFRIILNRPADITDIELLLRRNHRLQEEIAVIIAATAVAFAGLLLHQIKT